MKHKPHRVWNDIQKKYYEDTLPSNIIYDIINGIFINSSDSNDECNYLTIERFTGAEDKDDNPIYENDILEIEVNGILMYALVVYKDESARYIAEWKSCKTPRRQNYVDLDCDTAYTSRKVGHIHTSSCNPDHNGECLVCDCWLTECQLKEYIYNYGNNI